jgi:hypothetical protein
MDEPAILLVDVIQNELGLDDTRIAQYNQGFEAPTDMGLFVVISRGATKIISSKNIMIPGDPDVESKSVVMAHNYMIEVTSKDESANLRLHEFHMALDSTYSLQQQELNGVRLQRKGDPQDLSYVDGGSSLYRYQIPVTIFNVITKETEITTINNFPAVQTEAEGA